MKYKVIGSLPVHLIVGTYSVFGIKNNQISTDLTKTYFMLKYDLD